MIAIANGRPTANSRSARSRPQLRAGKPVPPAWHQGYLEILPDIRRLADLEVRNLRGEARADALHEIVADTVVAYARLAEQGKEDLAYPGPLVRYAGVKFRAGRRVGNRLNIKDVSSKYCQQRKGIVVERLGHWTDTAETWNDLLVEDRHATPAEIAATRIDFQQWLKALPVRIRRVAMLLAVGEPTYVVAEKVGLTSGRISQMRNWLRLSWYSFIGD